MPPLKHTQRSWHSSVDVLLISVLVALLVLGLTMVASASISIATQKLGKPFYYLYNQGAYMVLGLVGIGVVCTVEIKQWYRMSTLLMLTALLLLILVLIPGIGKVVNGSARWLNVGFYAFQVSEFCKFSSVLFMARYIVRHQEALTQQVSGFLRPMGLLALMSLLLLLEPDFGAMVVIISTAMGMLFLGGVPLWQFGLLIVGVGAAIGTMAISAPYRLKRLTSFLDPWAVAYDSGYQLTQALIAFGRGEWFGVGLGGSIQKLFYLPEAHTDFVFAVLAEELGLVGGLITLLLYALLVWRGMIIGARAMARQDPFAAFVCYGISIWLGVQTLINLGVNTGMLPTKGLTLPFLSYGGSSLVIVCLAAGLLIRVDIENRREQNPVGSLRKRHVR